MYENTLIPVLIDDESDLQASFAIARALAAKDAGFTLIHVLEDIPAYVAAQIPSEVLETSRREAELSLSQLAKGFPNAKAQLIIGHAGKSIVDYAEANNFDCIVLTSHRPGVQDIFLGSTAARVVRHAKCSVHVIR